MDRVVNYILAYWDTEQRRTILHARIIQFSFTTDVGSTFNVSDDTISTYH